MKKKVRTETEYLINETEYLIIETEYLITETEYLIIETEYLIIETEYLIIENVEKVSSVERWKKGATFIVGESMLARIEEKRIPGNRRAKFRIFPGAKTHGMYDFLKTLLKKNSDNIILYIGNNNSVNG